MMPDETKGTGMMDDMLADEGESTAPLARTGQPTGLDLYRNQSEISPEDVYIPNLRLAQGLTPEVQSGDARPGQWLITGFEPQAEVVVVPVAFFKRRELRDVDTREGLCYSADSITGFGTPGGECAVCSMNEWTGAEGARKPPACNFSYEYIVYSDTHQCMALLKFQKTAIKTGKVLNTAVAQSGLGNIAVRLKADPRQGPRGAFFSPTVVPVKVEAAVLDEAKRRFAESV